jgi:NAD(P)-dependent dehydrogenase (short-subunit alcohol dehydrogenase family)
MSGKFLVSFDREILFFDAKFMKFLITLLYLHQALARDIDDKYGRVDLIINCAGLLHIPDEIKPGKSVLHFLYSFWWL